MIKLVEFVERYLFPRPLRHWLCRRALRRLEAEGTPIGRGTRNWLREYYRLGPSVAMNEPGVVFTPEQASIREAFEVPPDVESTYVPPQEGIKPQ